MKMFDYIKTNFEFNKIKIMKKYFSKKNNFNKKETVKLYNLFYIEIICNHNFKIILFCGYNYIILKN